MEQDQLDSFRQTLISLRDEIEELNNTSREAAGTVALDQSNLTVALALVCSMVASSALSPRPFALLNSVSLLIPERPPNTDEKIRGDN